MTATMAAARTQTVPLFIYGASGMLAGELLRLLEQHPSLVPIGVSRDPAALAAAQPHCPELVRRVHALEAEREIARALDRGPAAAILALPHGESAELWRRLRTSLGARADDLYLVDLAADFRLADPALHARTYRALHGSAADRAGFVYGLPEFGRDAIQRARRVAAPGCFATALQLAALPAARERMLDAARPWIFDGVTGSSGSGNEPKPGTHHPHRHGNLWAYALDGHRHEAELEQALAPLAPPAPSIHFVPHSGPFARGIHLTAHLPLARSITSADARAAFARAYDGEPFIEVLESGVPDLRRVVGSNRASIAVNVRGSVLTVLVTLDNLVKGGAGQALQCLNLMLGYPETAGLPRSGMGVC